MKIEYKQVNDLVIAKMPTRLVYSNAEAIKNQLFVMMDEGYTNLAFDLSECEFVDSSGLAVVVASFKRAESLEGSVVLVSPSDNVTALIELTRLHKIFSIYQDESALVTQPSAA